MNKTINITNSGIETLTDIQVLDKRIAKLEKAVFKEPTEMASLADEEVRIIILGNIDRKLYAKVCTLCLSEDDVNVIYEKGGKEEARACFQNETISVHAVNYFMEKYGLCLRTAKRLVDAYGSIDAPKAKLESWLHELLENNGEKLAKVPYLGNRSFKEVMDKVGNK